MMPPGGAPAGPPAGPPPPTAGRQNPSQARNPHMPSYDPATAQGILSAEQKVADFSFRSGVGGHKSETPPDWLVNALDAG